MLTAILLGVRGTPVVFAGASATARALSARRGWSLIVTMAFVEGCTRTYPNKHWATDVIGGMLLVVTVFACGVLLPRTDGPPNGVAADTFGHDRVSTRISSREPDALSPEAC
jgi:membrane-associated phospholipid phosphatase